MGKKGIPAQRLAGDNRYATAAAISREGWQTAEELNPEKFFIYGGREAVTDRVKEIVNK
ncbi:MAG: hypothetical protein ACOX3R_10295 [Desulfitobacteriia bacterium]|jgi:putative cell wall-binding protein